MGTVGSGTRQQEAPTDRLPVQNFIGGMVKVDYQKCNLLVLHRARFSLKVPTQQLFITSFLLLEKLLGWHGNIFPPWISIPLLTFSSWGLRASLIPLHPFRPLLPMPYSFTWAFNLNCIWHPRVCTAIMFSGNDIVQRAAIQEHTHGKQQLLNTPEKWSGLSYWPMSSIF